MGNVLKNLVALLIFFVLLTAIWVNRDAIRRKTFARLGIQQEWSSEESASSASTEPIPALAEPTPMPLAIATTPAPAPVIATPEPAPAATPKLRATEPSELVAKFRDSLVFVTGEGAGSGFIADMGGRTFLITNAHVAAGVRDATFTTLQGTKVQPGRSSVAVAHDIFAMEAPAGGKPLEVMREVETNALIRDEVVVLGNTEGGGVITALPGEIVGLGPNLVEVSAPFLPGNSGSPIIHLKSGKVIGVATYLSVRKYDPATIRPDSVTRGFGYRVDSVKTWQPVNWASFQTQAREMEAVEQLTGDLVTFLKDLFRTGRVTAGLHTNPAIRSRVDAWMQVKSKQLSPKDRAAADQNFLGFLKVASQGDIENARHHLTYDYYQRQLAEQQRERAQISEAFSRVIANVQSSR